MQILSDLSHLAGTKAVSILGVVPELERGLGNFELGDIVRLNFQMRRQIVKEPHLVAHIQKLDCFADFLNRAHAGSFSRNFSDEKSEERMKACFVCSRN